MKATEKELKETKSKMEMMEAELKALKAAADQQGKGRKGTIKSGGPGARRGAAVKGGATGGTRK